MTKTKLIAEQIKRIRPLLKEANPHQKLKLMKLMKVALKENFDERMALIRKLASTGKYDVSDLELASDEELQQLLADEGEQDVDEGMPTSFPKASENYREPLWSYGEISQKLGITPNELTGLRNHFGFPEKIEGIKSHGGSKSYFKQSEIKRWVNDNDIRNIIKSNQNITESKDYLEEK